MITKNQLNNKKVFYKNIVWIIIVMFFIAVIYMPKIQPKAESVSNDFNILEIEPGNQFILGNANKTIATNDDFTSQETIDGANIATNLSGKKIGITHVTMQQFISQVDQINGKYDAVVIGRDNAGLRNGHNNPTNTALNSYIYGDYTNPLSETSKRANLVDEGYIPEGFGWRNIKNGDLVENNAYYEYYSENDITKKRAKEIIALIDSGQPVYIDSKIFDGSLSKTNLVSQFTSKINSKNCWKFTSDTNGILSDEPTDDPLTINDSSTSKVSLLDNIVINNLKITTISDNQTNSGTSAGSNIEKKNKRPVFSVTAPVGDSSGAVGSTKNRKLKFNINISDNVIVGEKLKVNLYLDVSGDTIFSDKELYYQEDITITNETGNYKTITYNMSNDFIGYLDWKVEVVRTLKDENGNNLKNANGDNIEVKSYKTGNLTLNPLQDQATKVIKVLQIYPNTNINNMDLVNDNTIKNTLLPQVKGYNLTITKKTVDEFNTMVKENDDKNKTLADKDKKSVLNGNYNMIIIGFADSYAGDKSGIFSQGSIEEIKTFIKTGQSVMFTHDTMPITIKDSSKDKIGNTFTTNYGPKIMGQNFRDAIGQSRYIDENNTNQKDIYNEYKATKDANGFISGGEYAERMIPHDTIQQKNDNTPTYSYGYASDILTDSGADASGGKTAFYQSSNLVCKVNNGLVNEYPFQIGDKLGDINVATTHHEWYQLNLEDPDVVPWYNIKLNTQSANNAWKNQYLDKYDSRDNYYTYSKGNITYSGTGHSSISGQTDELKLFVNTMIKAERGANHAPEIISSIPKENIDSEVNEIAANEDYTFSVDSNDLDKDSVYINVTIDGQELTAENTDMDKLKMNDDNTKEQYLVDTRNNSRKALSVKIPGKNLPKDKEISIKIEAEDSQGAKIEKNYKLKAVPAPQFNITADLFNITKVDNNNNPISSEVNDNSIKVKKDDIVKVQYKVNPGQLTYGNADDYLAKDVAIIVDKSIKSEIMTNIANGIDDSLFSNDNFVSNKNGNVQFDLITYGSGTISAHKDEIIDSTAKGSDGAPINYQGQLHNRLLDISKESTDANNLGGALEVAQNEFFDYYGRENSSKTIIIISGGNPTGDITNLAAIAKKNNYNIITLAITNDFNEENPYEQLYNWHNQLGGLPGDYYINKPDSDGQTSHNNIVSDTMPKIAEGLSLMKYKTYIIGSVKE